MQAVVYLGMQGGPPINAPVGARDPSAGYMRPPTVGPLFCDKILDFLTDGECSNNTDWKYRFKERNSDKMRTGSLMEVAVVLKGLLLLSQTKPLSFREKKMLERARYLLVSELAMAKNWDDVQVEDLLTKALAKSKLRFPEVSAAEA